MNNKLDPETLKIPAYMRKKMIISQSKQKLILTALDRKEAGLKHDSTKAVAPSKSRISSTPRTIPRFTVPKRPSPSYARAETHSSGSSQLSFGEITGPFTKIGEVTHYLDKIGVAIIMLSSSLKTGEKILVQGDGEIFVQSVDEMQIDRNPVKKASKGSHIGLKVHSPASVNGNIYRISA